MSKPIEDCCRFNGSACVQVGSHQSLAAGAIYECQRHRAVAWHVARLLVERPIREDDLIDGGVAPAPGCLVDDLKPSLLALQVAHVERVFAHRADIAARGPADSLPSTMQAQAELAQLGAAADPKMDESSFDGEFGAGQRARVKVGGGRVFPVAHDVGVDEALAPRSPTEPCRTASRRRDKADPRRPCPRPSSRRSLCLRSRRRRRRGGPFLAREPPRPS